MTAVIKFQQNGKDFVRKDKMKYFAVDFFFLFLLGLNILC